MSEQLLISLAVYSGHCHLLHSTTCGTTVPTQLLYSSLTLRHIFIPVPEQMSWKKMFSLECYACEGPGAPIWRDPNTYVLIYIYFLNSFSAVLYHVLYQTKQATFLSARQFWDTRPPNPLTIYACWFSRFTILIRGTAILSRKIPTAVKWAPKSSWKSYQCLTKILTYDLEKCCNTSVSSF